MSKVLSLSKENVTIGESDPAKVWNAMEGFAHYAFNKSHSVAYSYIAYQTAKLWVYRRNEVLEYLLNDGTKENQQAALEKCRELKMPVTFPDLGTEYNDRYKIEELENGKCILHTPIPQVLDEGAHYDGYVQLLTEADRPIGKLIQAGMCDKLTYDRNALLELVGYMMVRPKRIAANMEPEGKKFKQLSQILDGFKSAGAVTDWKRTSEGYDVYLTRANGKPPTYVHFRNNENESVRLERMNFDLKVFGAVRSGILSERPEIEYGRIVEQIERIKWRLHDNGQDDRAYEVCRKYLADYMRDYFSSERLRCFPDLYVLVRDVIPFSRNVKMLVSFDGVDDILYVGGELYDIARGLKKNSLVKMTMEYSPFIRKKTVEYIYDFDVTSLKAIKE